MLCGRCLDVRLSLSAYLALLNDVSRLRLPNDAVSSNMTSPLVCAAKLKIQLHIVQAAGSH